MSIGSAAGIGSLVRQYSDIRNLDLLAGQAKAAMTPGGSRQFVFGGNMIDDKNRLDGQQSWGYKWLDSYRTVLVQRAQTLQRKLNNTYTDQLGGNLYKSIADNPNYSMANLQERANTPDNLLDPAAAAFGNALFSLSSDMNGKSRDGQDPLSYMYGMPEATLFDFLGKAWDPLERDNLAEGWDSMQYEKPKGSLRFPWEHIGDYFQVINPLTDSIPMPPKAIPLIPPFIYFKMFDFVGDMLMPLFYPMLFSRYETFAHSDADANAIDAAVIRSDYNFNAPGIGQFPVVGQVIGGVLSTLAGTIVGASGGAGLTEDDVKAALDMLTNKQSNAMAPRQVETDTGGFFGATQALQDWDLDGMEYQYFSAANYQEDFIDTDFLAAFRVAGAKLFKILVNAILTASGFGNILKIPPLSFIADMLLEFISQMLMDGLLGPIRKFVEIDTKQAQRTDQGLIDADDTNTIHVGDAGGLFGLVAAANEPGGFALAYRDDDAYNTQALNSVTVYTNKKVLGDLWDGKGILQESDWEGTTYQSTSSRLHNVGYAPNPPLNLSTFRYNVNDRFDSSQHGPGSAEYDFDKTADSDAYRDTDYAGADGASFSGHNGGTYDRSLDYDLSATTKMGAEIDIGSRRLNPSFGGGILLTDLNTNLDDTFYYGSAAFLPDNGNSNTLTLDGSGNWVAANNGLDEQGNPITTPAPPSTPNTNLYSYAKMGTVTFDASSPTTDAYVFKAVDDTGAAITGLQVTYNGPDTLTGPNNAQPTNIIEARKAENYRVTNIGGGSISATIVTDTSPAAFDYGTTPPGSVDVRDWIMANSSNDKKYDDTDTNPTDDKTTDHGKLDLSLNYRIEPLLPVAVDVGKDDDATANLTTVQLVDQSVFNFLNGPNTTLGASGAPSTGANWTAVNTGNLHGNLSGLSYTNWTFVANGAKDFNQDGDTSDTVFAGYGNSLEAASPKREAWTAFNQLIASQVPSNFFHAEQIDPAYRLPDGSAPTDEWALKYSPWNPDLTDPTTGTQSGYYDTTTHNPASGVPAYNSTNPYFWKGTDGYDYVTVWSNRDTNGDGYPDERDSTGRPTASAVPVAVYRYNRASNGADHIEIVSSNALPAGSPRPVLMHRENQIVTVDDDTGLAPPATNSKLLRLLDDLRNRGYTQGMAIADPDNPGAEVAAYNLQGTVPPASPPPPAGTPGDFTIMKQADGQVTIAFTRSYSGLNDVPPSQWPAGDPKAGKPREDWTAVNGWYITNTTDAGLGARTYSPGQRKIMVDHDVDGSNIWALQDYMHPTVPPVYASGTTNPSWFTGSAYGVNITGYLNNPSLVDPLTVGRKFNLDDVDGDASEHYVVMSADNAGAVFVNGYYLGDTSSFTTPTKIPIPPEYLRPGENIITAQSFNSGGPGGLAISVVANGVEQVNTSAAQASQWQILKSPIVGTADEMTLERKITVNDDVLPGEFLDISWSGVNAMPYMASGVTNTKTYQSILGITTGQSDSVTALLPDRASLTITNAKGTFTIPLTQLNSDTGVWEEKDSGTGTFHIPSDYLAAGTNTFKLNVERGGVVQQFCMNEPPNNGVDANGNLLTVPASQYDEYKELASAAVQNAGYWVSGDIKDESNVTVIPAGTLMYGGQPVGPMSLEGGNLLGAIGGLASYSVNSDGIIVMDVKDPILGTSLATVGVRPSMFVWKPDSYFDRSTGIGTGPTTVTDAAGNHLPIFQGLTDSGLTGAIDPYSGYMMKKDIREGMSMGNADDSQLLHNFETMTVDRYVYNPNTQTVMDVMRSNQSGLEGIDEDLQSTGAAAGNGTLDAGEDIAGQGNAGQLDVNFGSETQGNPWSNATDHVNIEPPMILKGASPTPVTNGGGAQMVPGSSAIGNVPVGIKISKDDRQTFGSDDNQLTRTLYAAMKPIDIDGSGDIEADSRAYKEYRDCFNYGLLDHIYISGSAYAPSGGGFSSTIEFNWKTVDVATKAVDHTTALGTDILGTAAKTIANSYMNNYEYFANETDRRNKKYTVVRRGDMLMNSFYSFRKEQ